MIAWSEHAVNHPRVPQSSNQMNLDLKERWISICDRVDIHLEVPLVDFRELSSNPPTGDKSETIRERVAQGVGPVPQGDQCHQFGDGTKAIEAVLSD